MAVSAIGFPGRRDALERDFLPAALEVLESPPSPLGRALGLQVMTMTMLVLAWSVLGHVDTVAVAGGRVVPGGHVKTVQPLEMGVVRVVAVREGERVVAGQVLMALDDTATAADVARLRHELADARLSDLRLRALADAASAVPAPGFEHDARGLAEQRRLFADALAEQAAAVARVTQRRREADASLATLRVQAAKLAAAIPLLSERTAALHTLADARVASRTDYLALAQQLVELQHDREGVLRREDELRAAAAALDAELDALRAGFARDARERALDSARRVQALEGELRKAERRHELRVLRAPVDGTVQQVAVTSVGAVVTPAEPLMTIVPNDVALEIEANVGNRDAGFVFAGQPVEVKVDSFPFTRYGLLAGRVEHVAADAVAAADGTLAFPARITLDGDSFTVEGDTRRISPGMRVSAEIRTGERRLIDFFLSPVMRYGHEALRER